MALPFFFNPQLEQSSKTIQLDEATSKHVAQVLRMKEGEQLNLTNGKGLLARMEITAATKKSCSVMLLESEFSAHHASRRTGIAISPVKNSSRFEWFLEKATELGVSDIFPLLCTRTEREHFRFDRMNAICISAMLQSQQTWLPVLHQPIAFDELVVNSEIPLNNYTHKWIAHCTVQKKQPLVTSLTKAMKDSLILIGPEGDFTPEEITTATKNGYHPVALGDTRLRTETAGMIAAGLLILC
ncbi:MAG: RsmE family RNA methyltransferase [Bacteroidota bacterium]